MPNYGIFTNFMFCRCYLKKNNKQKRRKKCGKCSSLCHDIIFLCRDTKFKQAKGTMSQPVTKCRNAAKSFFVATLLKKIVKKTVATILDPVATMIKAESKGAVSRQYNLCRNIKN